MFPDSFGAYFWGGYDVPNALVPGLTLLRQAGFASTARIRLLPAVRPASTLDRGEYRFDAQWEAEVPPDVPFLPAAVRSTQYQLAFALPIRNFVFTAYDSASSNELFNPTWLEANEEVVRSEYRDMTIALHETQQGTGKRFIVCNWEGDSMINLDPYDAAETAKRIDALTIWFRLRQEGIREGRAIALDQGWDGVEVNDAIEFNNLYYWQDYRLCFPGGFVGDVFQNIIPVIKPDYAAYSAWGSVGRGRLLDDLLTAKARLHAATNGHTQLIIGELGVTGHAHPNHPSREPVASKSWRYTQIARAAVRAEIPIVIFWKAWDYFATFEGEGLFEGNGSGRQTLKDLQANFETAALIGGVVDQFDMYGWRAPDQRRYFELYGRFPGARDGNDQQPGWVGNYRAIIEFADGEIGVFETVGESERQINIALSPHYRDVRWFLLRVRRKRDGLTSPEFGPVRLNRLLPPTTDCKDAINQRWWDHWGS
jgi:hypothetical protein